MGGADSQTAARAVEGKVELLIAIDLTFLENTAGNLEKKDQVDNGSAGQEPSKVVWTEANQTEALRSDRQDALDR